MIPDVTGVVLAGGRSSRFGSDKAAASWKTGTLAGTVVSSLLAAGLRVLVVSKGQERGFLERPGVRLLRDTGDPAHPLSHPLLGIRSALLACPTPWAFVAACDMPFLQVPLVRRICAERGCWEAVLPEWRGRAQPLCGLYSRSCLPAMEAFLSPSRKGSVLDFARSLRVRWLREAELAAADPEGRSFVDLDDPAAYKEAQNAVLA